MEGELDLFDFDLAEMFGCTVEEMYDRLSNLEYHRWRARFEVRAEMQKLAMDAAKAKAGLKGARGRKR